MKTNLKTIHPLIMAMGCFFRTPQEAVFEIMFSTTISFLQKQPSQLALKFYSVADDIHLLAQQTIIIMQDRLMITMFFRLIHLQPVQRTEPWQAGRHLQTRI